MKSICFFSSDARPLYKSDIFRTMSYPNDYVIHFRYQRSHIEGDPLSFKGRTGIIFFSMGNDLSIDPANRIILNTSIREVIIYSIEKSDDTGQVHFYLKLKDFTKTEVSNNQSAKMPPNKFVAELEITEGTVIKWYEVIDLIKASFIKQLFYRFEIVDKKKNKLLIPEYDEVDKQSFYKLSDEKSYALKMSFYDTEPSNSDNYHSLRITPMDSDLIKVVAPTNIDLETRKDNRVYSIFTQTLSSSSSYTYVNFETLIKSATSKSFDVMASVPIIDTTLKIEVGKNVNRTFKFAFFSLVAAIALGYGKILSDKVDLYGSFDAILLLQFIICGFLGFLAAFNLYRLFDKK